MLITFLSHFIQVPESPLWLLSKKRDKSALKSLQWLRGWVPQKVVQEEFDSIKRHKELSNSCNECKSTATELSGSYNECKSTAIECTHRNVQNLGETMKELIQKRTIMPFSILMTVGGVAFFSGAHHLAPYMVQILNTYSSPISPNLATVR